MIKVNPFRFIACLGAATLAALMHGIVPARAEGREPVLKQVAVPHSYYWREMYIPQLTTGPSGAAWSSDGEALYFSAKGRIWRQKLTSDVAEQITDGDSYDYQPDISPDGRRLVFARYAQDAIELVVRDLRSGRESPLTANGAVNIDPRWSPDGKKIAFVSTDETGHFHIAIAENDGRDWTVNRWRDERTTQAPRYYYSQTDHELSPAWSPDGREILFVSNADLQHGAGFIYRQAVDLSSPPVVVREEETSWKSAPDVSPDGKRIAYASYLGRQWHQLWMVSAESGDYPMPFTYGEFDIQRPRWSPEGDAIAYITNEGGGLAIVVQKIVGGARKVVKTKHWATKEKPASLTITTLNQDGAPASARISVRASDGRDYAPDDAMFHADDAYDRDLGPSEIHYFHSVGAATLSLPPGEAVVTVWRGLETVPVRQIIALKNSEVAHAKIQLRTIDDDGAFSNWRSADVHVHMNYGGAYRMDPVALAAQADAEDLDLVFNLLVNKEQRIPDIDYFTPVPVRYETSDAIIAQAQEFHTSIWGHLGLLGLDDHILISDYAGYPETAAHSLYPDNPAVADLAHAQTALVGYVHPFDPPAPDPSSDGRLTHMLPVNAALGKIDYMEIVGFSDHRTTEGVWHRLLNCGFRIPAAGGTDAMTNYASLRGPLGVDRTYVEMADAPKDPAAFVEAWLDGLKAGRSFASNGPLVQMEVEGAGAGEVIVRKKSVSKLSYKARMSSITPIDSVEILYNGKVVATLPLSRDGRQVDAAGEIEVEASGWLSMRASGKNASRDVFDLYPYGVTSPIYVEIGGKRPRSAADADYFIAWIDKIEAYARASEAYNTEAERKAVLANLSAAKKEFKRRR